jgi:AraC-like DNA-binding protein
MDKLADFVICKNMNPLQTSEGLIEMVPHLPRNWSGKKLSGAESTSYHGKLGTIVLQQIQHDDYALQFLQLRVQNPLTLHHELEMGWQSILSLKGRMSYTMAEEEHELSEGQFLLFYGESGKRLSTQVPSDTDIQIWATRYHTGIFKNWVSLFPKLRLGDSIRKLFFLAPAVSARTGILDSIRDQFYEQYSSSLQPAFRQIKVQEQLFGLLSQAHNYMPGKKLTPWEKEAAFKTQQIIMRDLRVHHSNEDLAKEVGMDRGTLNKAFKAEYGLGMFEYLARARFEKSREMLLAGLPIKKIAADMGYKRSSTFAYEFRKYYGYSPVDLQDGERFP